MILELSDNKIFKECFNGVSRIVDECTIECDSAGIRLRALDRSHISFINLNFNASLFDEYECDVPETVSIDTIDFNQILKRCKGDDVLKINTADNDLIITFDGDSKRTFKLRLIDLDYDTPNPPYVDLPVNLNLNCNIITDALKDISLYSEKITFNVDGDYLKITGGDEYGSYETKFIHGEDVNEDVKCSFSLDKIDDMLKLSSICDVCSLYLGNDMPLKLVLNINKDDGFISFLLAPRLEEEGV